MAYRKGVGFAITTSITTILAMISGMYNFGSLEIILGGILVVGLADAMGDAFGIHVFEETGRTRKPWDAPLATFVVKLLVSLSFFAIVLLIPEFFFVSVLWGFVLISAFTYVSSGSLRNVLEHIVLAVFIIVFSYYIGWFISNSFGYSETEARKYFICVLCYVIVNEHLAGRGREVLGRKPESTNRCEHAGRC